MRSTEWIPGRRQLLLATYLGLLTFIVAHIVNAFIADALLQPLTPAAGLSPEISARPPVSAQQWAQDVMGGGLFPLPPELAELAEGSSPTSRTNAGPPLDVTKKLLLQGTALGWGNGTAILQDRGNQQQKLYRLHDHVSNVGELAAIEKDRVLFRDGSREEWLELALVTELKQSPRILLPTTSSADPVPNSSLHMPPPRRTPQMIDRRELTDILSDIPRLFLHGQPVPSFAEGRFNGLRLDNVNYLGFFGKLGLQSGDILRNINGAEIRDPGMLISVLQQLKHERSVTLDILRNNDPRTFAYVIR